MKKLVLLIVCMFFFTSTSLAAPAAPQMSYSLNGTNITVDWSAVPGATGYTLYYAAYPYAPGDYIGSLDRGENKSYSIELWDGAAYYIATSARNAQGSSGYSNIEYFIMKDHELNWEDNGMLGSARTRFAGGVIDDRIYSFGGYNENDLLLNSLEIYDPSTDSWTFGTANTTSVADLSGAVVSKKLYVFGATGEDCGTTPFAEKYDPDTAQWSMLAAKTTQTSGAPAVSYNGKVYLFGGWQLDSCNDTGKVLKKNVEAYDPLANSWQPVTTMPKALEGATVAVYDDKAYVIGGVDDQGHYATDIIAYDFIENSWTESGLGSLNTPRMFPANSSAPVIEDTIVLVGGWVESSARSTNANRVESNLVELYSPRTRSVAIGVPLPEATAGHLPAVINGDLFVIGGIANERATDRSWKAEVTIENEIRGTNLESDIDGDGFTLSEDCNDSDQSINPGASEICEDGIDQNCDGIDEECSVSSSGYAIVLQMLRHQTAEAGDNSYRGYVQLTRNGQSMNPDDFIGVSVTDSTGEAVSLTGTPGVWTGNYVKGYCPDETCTWDTADEAGVYFKIGTPSLGNYTVTLDMTEGQLSTVIPFSEDVELPVITSPVMSSEWQGGDLHLSWSNPTTAPNWDMVNWLVVGIKDSGGNQVGWIKLDPSRESFVVPSSELESMKSLGDGTLASWHLQTRRYSGDVQNSQTARGYSFNVPLPEMPSLWAYVQWRTYEGGANNGTKGWVSLPEGVMLDDVTDARLVDAGGDLVAAFGDFNPSSDHYLWYNCFTGSCSGKIVDEYGYWLGSALSGFSAGTYTYIVDTEQMTYEKDVDYQGAVSIPVIQSATVEPVWEGDGSLTISWDSPTTDPNWSLVDQIRVVIQSETYETRIYVKLSSHDNSVTIPLSEINRVFASEADKALIRITMQTRANGFDGSNYSRGISDRVDLAYP